MVNPSKDIILAKKKSKKNKSGIFIVDKTGTDIDRVGSIEQKEIALSLANLKRVEVYRRIKEMLDAVKVVERDPVGGVVTTEEEPDMVMRAKGVELALKAFGDLKEFERVGGNVTHNKVVYQWLNVQNNTEQSSTRAIDE